MAMINLLLFVGIAGAAVGFGIITFSRSSKLASLAQNYGCRFERRKNSVTTALCAGKLELFILFFHQFKNVFTFTTNTAFIRLADDFIFLNDDPKTKPISLTLFTAEMRKIQFPPLKIVPVQSPLTKSKLSRFKINIPDLDARFHFYSQTPQAGKLFSPFIINLLREKETVYLETNEAALIYHEHALIDPKDIDAFRFHAMKILNEFETLVTTAEAKPNQNSQEHPTETRAQALLQSFMGSRPTNPPNQSLHIFWLIVVFALFLGITFLSWFALHHWLGR